MGLVEGWGGKRLRQIAGAVLIAPIRFYRYCISPWLPPSCRFVPTCSQYAMDAIRAQGAMAGGWLAAKRICRCHPWGRCGHDPVRRAESRIITPEHTR